MVSYLVLETSYYTKQQFKCYKSLDAYNQMVSGFVTSVQGKIIARKHVVVGKVRHSQRMNDPLVNIWVITESDGTILAAHCLGCKAGLAESCLHIASVLFYIEAWIRINGKLACTQVKSSWLLPTYVNEVSYERVKDIDFSSSKKLKENLDQKINSLEDKATKPSGNYRIQSSYKAAPPSAEEIGTLFTKVGNCKTKAVVLSLIPAYADQFVAQSRAVPVVSDVFITENLDMNLDISDEQTKRVEKATRSQAKGSGFFKHRAGRIGASASGVAFHSNLKSIHKNFSLTRCGLFINKEHPFLHAILDFLTQCDCCGLGCEEVKNPLTLENGDFEKYATHRHSCLEKKDDKFALKRTHDYYCQVQQ